MRVWNSSVRAFGLSVIALIGVSGFAQTPEAAKLAHDYPVGPVPFTAVHLQDQFWAPRIELNRTTTIPFAFGKCEETGRVKNFQLAATALQGGGFSDVLPGFPFDDTDVYKVIEGASYGLSVHPDAEMDAYIDSLIVKIAAAQEKDGYLYTARTMNPAKPHAWSGAKRWQNEEDGSHELYDLGHLYEAAVAHYQATGKRTLLDIALKSANLLVDTFGPGKQSIYPGHQIAEMGLVKLYRVTGDERYLNLAKFMLDSRGPYGKAYNQADAKVVDQTEAEGHAVRAMYMYSGMADVAALTGDPAYAKAIDKIWNDVASRKLYITGGIGAVPAFEGFGEDYELPNMGAYNETCASIGSVYWNQRQFLLHADAKYIDVLERTLYNGVISGVSLDGKSFFYPNVLESKGQHERSPWFGCACCPSNITRFMASVPGYVYAERGDTLFVNLYAESQAEVKLDDGRKLKLVQHTRYPWDGAIDLTVTPEHHGRFTIKMRIPGWAREEAVPSDLYRFVDKATETVTLQVNDRPVPLKIENGYVTLTRDWSAGDRVALWLPMPVRRIAANDKVKADLGRVALQRGPFVYALEGADNGAHVRNLVLQEPAKLISEIRLDLLDGVTVITGSALALAYDAQGGVTKKQETFMAIPYYAWANRGRGEMMVWIPVTEADAKPTPYPSLAMQSKVTTSKGSAPYVNDGDDPLSSWDEGAFYSFGPAKGTTEWLQYEWAKPATVSESAVYWFDNSSRIYWAQDKLPASWRLLYKDGNDWKPVEAAGAYGVERDKYNQVSFHPVTTTALRLEVKLQDGFSAAVQQWKVK